MQVIVMPPGAAGKPHIHLGYEAAIFILEGEVLTRYGDGLSQSIVSRAGEFLFIPANVPHQPVNLSRTTPARAIIARNYPAMKGPTKPYVGPAGN